MAERIVLWCVLGLFILAMVPILTKFLSEVGRQGRITVSREESRRRYLAEKQREKERMDD